MIGLALIAAVVFTAWTIWEEAKLRTPKAVQTTPRAPTPVEVVWEESVDNVESKRQMLDRIFSEGNPDLDEDPPTVVADRL
jgi:hypothetical protein